VGQDCRRGKRISTRETRHETNPFHSRVVHDYLRALHDVFPAGASGAGRTTFYESKLRENFPILLKSSSSPLEQSEFEKQRKELLKSNKSFVFQSSIADTQPIDEAHSDSFEVKVIFIGTEHSDLNIARILSRVSRGGPFAPTAMLRE
jgi:hypothetical protein